MSDNTAVFPYQSPPLGNSVSWENSLTILTLEEVFFAQNRMDGIRY